MTSDIPLPHEDALRRVGAAADRLGVEAYVVGGAVRDAILRRRTTDLDFVTVGAATSNTLSPEILEYQFNEVRTSRVANTASSTIAPPYGVVNQSPWQGDPQRFGYQGNEAGAGCLAANNVSPYSKVETGWFLDFRGSHTIMFWSRRQA